jgi:DNA polymerase-3 subunit gamma/tau
VNGLDYEEESIHLDIIEIDAASNRRIDEIRELRDKVHISPTSAKYKVYIIDEVHMLTREAFNALLKTLEEPPAHAIFILATTEAHKLPETIVSRTQRFEFKPIGNTSAIDHLTAIAKKEKIDIDKAGLSLLAEHGQGSFRDSISLLDQLASRGGRIGEQDVRDFLGLPPASLVQALAETVAAGDTAGALSTLDSLREQGANPALVARLLAREVRKLLISNPEQSWAAELLRHLIDVPASHRPADSLEIAVLQACARADKPAAVMPAKVSTPVQKTTTKPVEAKESVPADKPEPAKPAKKESTRPARKDTIPFDEQAWEQIVARVRDQAASLYTALRLATPEVDQGKLTLAFQFPLHQKKVNEAEHRDLIGRIVAEVTGQDMAIEPVVDKAKKPVAKPAAEKKVVIKPANESLGTISNIFGTAEVIES